VTHVQDIEIEQAGSQLTVTAAVDESFETPDGVSTIAFLLRDTDADVRFDDDAPFDVIRRDGNRSRFVVLRRVGRQRLAVR